MSISSTPAAPAVNQPANPAANPAEIAREAFRRLATRRIAPTPDNYRAIYDKIAGIAPAPPAVAPAPAPDSGAIEVLAGFARRMAETPGELAEYGRRMTRAVKLEDWTGYTQALGQMSERHLRRNTPVMALGDEEPDTVLLREMLARTLSFACASLLSGDAELSAEAEALGAAVKTAVGESELQDIAARLKQLCFQIELRKDDGAEQQELLLRLFRLLLDNIEGLLDDDNYMRGQVLVVQELIKGPLDTRALEDATRGLKDVIIKQGHLKHGIDDVRGAMKNMMMTFIDRLGSVAASTGDHHARLAGYSDRIGRAASIDELNEVMEEVLREMRAAQDEALASRDRMVAVHREVQEAEERIRVLEAELQHMSELVREDQLTGSLNRRGLDDVFERESARADRRNTPLCVAILDLDNFKKLNDTYGHLAGDGALKHLVKVVRDTLRSMDVIARFGGEEFVILMPETPVEAAAAAMVRVQRELTRHFFLHENEKMLITFSCGVALRTPNEDQASLVGRADRAMYRAKQSGKNRVVVAD